MNHNRRIFLAFNDLVSSLKSAKISATNSRTLLKKNTFPFRSQHAVFSGTGSAGVTSRFYIISRYSILLGIGSGFSFFLLNDIWRRQSLMNERILVAASKTEEEPVKMSRREQRFHQFASSEYNGQIVMTPFDFIESIIENQPKISRRGKFRLTQKDIEDMIASTPGIEDGKNTLFRDLNHNGVITYSEYLFLVTILTKSSAGLKTALKMMDVNGDQEITSEEFHLVVSMINKAASQNTRGHSDVSLKLNHTTLLLHLFGENADKVVSFERFFKFMDDFHEEVLELEFHEYSKSLKRISEVDFAKILLRNTILSEQEYSEYIDRLKTRIEYQKGVTMEQFKSFHEFLNNIEDFIIAVNMTNVVHQPVDKAVGVKSILRQPVDKDLFSRAIKVTTGEDIDPYVIDVIFKLFDKDGDGKLSQQEFIGIMKDRLKRGFGKFPNVKGMSGFKHCLKKEMTRPME